MSIAGNIMRRHNPHMLVVREGGHVVGIEDHSDPDGRLFRFEYRATPDGKRAIAILLWNPWGQNPYSHRESHLGPDGVLCLASGATSVLETSTLNLESAIRRTRYWATAFSVLMETGRFPQL